LITDITFNTEQKEDYPYCMVYFDGGYVAFYPQAIVVQSHRPITAVQNSLARVTIEEDTND